MSKKSHWPQPGWKQTFRVNAAYTPWGSVRRADHVRMYLLRCIRFFNIYIVNLGTHRRNSHDGFCVFFLYCVLCVYRVRKLRCVELKR